MVVKMKFLRTVLNLSFFLFHATVEPLVQTESVENTQEKRILLEEKYYSILSRLDALEKEVTVLRNKADLQPSRTVAFMARLTTSVSGLHHHIYFKDVKLNLGNAYNPHHGMFVAPVNGTYQFTVSACSTTGHFIVLQINANDSVLGKVIAGDDAYSDCNANLFLTHLTVGDDVYIQHVDQGDYLYAYEPNSLPNFTGLLIQAD